MLHVAFIAIYLAWMRGGTVPDYYAPLPWLAVALLEMTILFPVLKKGETDSEGRTRVLRSILRDPVFYIGIVFLAFLGIQCANGPCELTYDVELGAWKYTDPPFPNLPSCIDREETSQLLYWFAPVYAVVLAIRHGMSRKSKMNLLRVLVVSGALLALVGTLQFITGTKKIFWMTPIDVQFFASFGYPNHAGSYFTLMFSICVGLLLHALGDEENHGKVHWIVICLVLNLLGATLSLCRAAICLSWGIALVAVIYGFAYVGPLVSKSAQLRSAMLVIVGLGIAAFIFFVAYPDNSVRREINSIFHSRRNARIEKTEAKAADGDAKAAGGQISIENPFAGDRTLLREAAVGIWKDYPWTGVGGWAFRRYVGLYVDQSQWNAIRTRGRANVHNDFLQYLCENGLFGVGLIFGTIIVLLVPIWHRLVNMVVSPKNVQQPEQVDTERVFVFRVSPIVWFMSIGTLAVVVHSLVDLPFRCPAIMVLWFICLAVMPAFMPKPKAVVSAAKDEGGHGGSSSGHHHHHHHHADAAQPAGGTSPDGDAESGEKR